MTDEALSQLARLSVSLPAELLAQLDAMVAERGLPSRSQMIAELIRHFEIRLDDMRPVIPIATATTIPSLEPWFRLEPVRG